MVPPPIRLKPSPRSVYFQRRATVLFQSCKSPATKVIECQPHSTSFTWMKKTSSWGIWSPWEQDGWIRIFWAFFSITISPVVKQNYVNVYGFDITDRKIAENHLLDNNNILGGLVAGKPFQENLNGLTQQAEKHSAGMMSAILILDKSKKIFAMVPQPNLPA